MKRKQYLVILIFHLFAALVMAQPDWPQNLRPFVSSKNDIDNFGVKPTLIEKDSRYKYRFSDASIEIEIEPDGFCSSSRSKWNIPSETIVSLVVNYRTPMLFSSFSEDISKFKEHRLKNDLPGIFLLSYLKGGYAYTVDETLKANDLMVLSKSFGATESQQNLRCVSKK